MRGQEFDGPSALSEQTALSAHGLDRSDLPDLEEVPATCAYGCFVPPDGRCEHGHPAVSIPGGA